MKCNIGKGERSLRIVLGLGFLLAGYSAGLPAWLAVAAYAVGGVLFLTGSIRFCPLWSLFGVDTCSGEKKATIH